MDLEIIDSYGNKRTIELYYRERDRCYLVKSLYDGDEYMLYLSKKTLEKPWLKSDLIEYCQTSRDQALARLEDLGNDPLVYKKSTIDYSKHYLECRIKAYEDKLESLGVTPVRSKTLDDFVKEDRELFRERTGREATHIDFAFYGKEFKDSNPILFHGRDFSDSN